MMKQISHKNIFRHIVGKAFAVILVGAAFTACDDFLTDEPRSQITTQQAYGTVEDLKNNALLSVYNYIGGHVEGEGLQGTARGVYDLNSLTTDEQIIPVRGGDWFDGGIWLRLFFHIWENGEAPITNAWNYLFKVVAVCNEGIEHIDAFPAANDDEKILLKEYKAELRAVRAMYYFYLIDLYGRVPLVTSTAVKSADLTLSPRRDVFYWIYNELNESLPYLRIDWSHYPNTLSYGRMTAFVAYFVMMKLALNAEIYTDNDWTDNAYPDGRKIELSTYDRFSETMKTENAWETVCSLSEFLRGWYNLTEYYGDNFDVTNESSCENIFVIPMDRVRYSNQYNYFNRSRHYCHGAALAGPSENGTCATASTIRTFGYSEEHKDSFVDYRFGFNFYYDTVYVSGRKVYLDDGVTPLVYLPLAVNDFDLSGKPCEKTAGARIAKYSREATLRNDSRLGNNDIVLFRYADVILMHAEAVYRLGDEKRALEILNEVCLRTSNPKRTTINDDVLLNERLMELMWEGWRRNDLIRFHRYHLPYDLKIWGSFAEDTHTTVFPIPANMMTMHPSWEQNPGYNE